MKHAVLLSLLLIGCAKAKVQEGDGCLAIPKASGAPSIMVIGDSISMGYEPAMALTLTNYDVLHSPCNAMNSRYTLRNLDAWLTLRPSYEAITFNNGMWDIATYVWADYSFVPDAEYESNLHAIAQKIKAKTAHPLFILSTAVPAGSADRLDVNIQAKNAIAVRVMAAENVPVLDLYTFSLTLSSDHIAPNNVHYTAAGSQALATRILLELNNLYGVN